MSLRNVYNYIVYFIVCSNLAKAMLQTCMMMAFACCRSDFIYDLFEHMSLSTDQAQSTGFSRAQKKGAKKKATVSSQFKVAICTVNY